MAKVAKIESLSTTTNTELFSFDISQKILINYTKFKKDNLDYDEKVNSINAKCEELIKNGYGVCYLEDQNNFIHISLDNYFKFKRNEENKLIYKIENSNKNYSISTGIYCGVLNFKNDNLKFNITTNLSDKFFKRILNYCCGIYVDTDTDENSEANESIYSLLIQYLFLMSLRKVANKAIPTRYITCKDRGYNVNGNIEINDYVNNDLLKFDKKVTYSYQKRLEIQPIVDVLYTALKACKINSNRDSLPDINRFETHVSEMYSGKRPSRKMVNEISKNKCLCNSLYSDFKRPLDYAKILIKNNDLNNGDSSNLNGVGGFLVDSSFLWEMYLYNLMRLYLKDWDIESQSVISFYSDTFYAKNNYPDFVLRNKYNNKIFVLDAKFKKMTFKDIDVDNNDLRQLHAYSYYYSIKEKENFRGAGLIYPTKIDKPKDSNNIDYLYGLIESECKFGIFAIKDPSENETIADNERKFIEELKDFLEN